MINQTHHNILRLTGETHDLHRCIPRLPNHRLRFGRLS